MGIMKIRYGFVSNSSSTSFCIYGIYFYGGREDKEKLYEAADEAKLFVHNDQDCDGLYIGREWSTIGDSETGSDFKLGVEQLIDKLPIIEGKECSTYDVGWYNG